MRTPDFAGSSRLSGLRSPVAGVLLLAAGGWLLGGCALPIPPAQSDLTRYFVLEQQVHPAGEAGAEPAVTVRVKPVDVPAYLNDRPLAVRRGGNEIHYLEPMQWGEPLDQGLARNIRLGLGSIPGITVLSRYDAGDKWDYDLKVRVSACEGSEDRSVRFSLEWVLEPGPNSPLPRRTGSFAGKDLTWDGRAPESLVAALSRGVTQFCESMAGTLKASR